MLKRARLAAVIILSAGPCFSLDVDIPPNDAEPDNPAVIENSLQLPADGQHRQQTKSVNSVNIVNHLSFVERLEIEGGAYNPDLSEQLLSLGLAYYANFDYAPAIAALKRSVFITRVNSGLNNPQQIPINQQLISAHIGQGNFQQADELQFYLYRIKTINYTEDMDKTVQAMLDYAEWHRHAFLLNLGKPPHHHLILMHDLYQQAFEIISTHKGELSMALIPALEGLLSVQYLLSGYNGENPEKFQVSMHTTDNEMASRAENRLLFLRTSAYKQGRAILKTLHTLHSSDMEGPDIAPVEDIIAAGDWHLWYNEQKSAMTLYREAYLSLLDFNNPKDHLQRYFGSPVELPTNNSYKSKLLESNYSSTESGGRLLVSFSVSRAGRPYNINVLESEPETPSRQQSRILRDLKTIQFRPRFENGEAVKTENIVKEYVY